MGPAAPGFVLGWDVVPFDAAWVLVPGFVLLGLSALLLLVRWRARRPRRALATLATVLALLCVWWTLGGIGAWRMGIQRLRDGTANFVEGPVQGASRPQGGSVSFEVGGQRFFPALDAFFPALHATRWPTVPLVEGQLVRVWFFGGDVLRLELGRAQGGSPSAHPR